MTFFPILIDVQMSNKMRVEYQPEAFASQISKFPWKSLEQKSCADKMHLTTRGLQYPRAMLVTEIGGARPPNEIVLD